VTKSLHRYDISQGNEHQRHWSSGGYTENSQRWCGRDIVPDTSSGNQKISHRQTDMNKQAYMYSTASLLNPLTPTVALWVQL